MALTKTAQKLVQTIADAHYKLIQYQNKCKHVGHTREFECNDGNYDPSQDRGWYRCFCSKCNKIWVEYVKTN